MPNLAVFPTLNMNGAPIPSVPWTHWISNKGGVSEGSFSYGKSAITESYLVYYNDALNAVRDLQGYSNYNGATGNLDRTPPARHPYWYWLYCDAVHVRPLRWRSKGAALFGTGSSYDFALLSCSFAQPRYRVLDDNTLDNRFPPRAPLQRQEWQRFVEFVPQVAQETITRDVGQFRWARTAGGNPIANSPFPAPVPMQLSKGDFVLNWKKVPLYQGLLSATTGLADNLLNAASHPVDSGNAGAGFLGTEAGTLRFNGARITPVEAPVSPQTMGMLNDGDPSLVADVEISLSYWDPPPGDVQRGHNLAPYADPAAGTNNWFLITVDGTTTGASIYATSDLSLIFQLPG